MAQSTYKGPRPDFRSYDQLQTEKAETDGREPHNDK